MEGNIKDRTIEVAQGTFDTAKRLAERIIGRLVGTAEPVVSRVADALPAEVTDRVEQARDRAADIPWLKPLIVYVPGLNGEASDTEGARSARPTSATGTAKMTTPGTPASRTRSSTRRPNR